MENVGSAPIAERSVRELEGIIEETRATAERVSSVAGRLCDMRRRLLGIDQSPPPEVTPVSEVPGSEVSDLRITLGGINLTLNDIEEYVGNLENV